MNQALHVSIVSPTKTVFDGLATMVEIPGVEGDMGVLPHHAATLTRLREGTITLHGADKSSQKFAVKDGYADVSETGCVILSEQIDAA